MNADISGPNRKFLNGLFLAALLVFIMIAGLVFRFPENRFDRFVEDYLKPLANTTLLPFWIGITFFGSFQFLFPSYVILVIILVVQRKRRLGLSIASLAIGGFLSVQVLKMIFQRPRPAAPLIPDMTDFSFPSGHCTSSFLFCAVIIYCLRQKTESGTLRISGAILIGMLLCLVGMSRIVLAVHHPTDVIAGFCLGTLWITAWYRYIKTLP